MLASYEAAASCVPSHQGQEAYIYTIIPTAEDGLAAITSADELLILDRYRLATSPILRLQDVPQKLSCLISGDDAGKSTLSCGSDGIVATHDLRAQTRCNHFKIDRAVTALARRGHYVAVGTELTNHQAVVSVWDQRLNKSLWQNAENNDDITAIDFHPSRDHILLTGGDDGQVSLFNTSIAEEEDSLLQGVNHGPIHKAGFLGDHRFFALSSDQNLSIHSVASPSDEQDPLPTLLGDLRNVISCEYVIDVFGTGQEFAVAAGSNLNDPKVKIVEIHNATDTAKVPELKIDSGCVLDGGHGEDVVRSVFADDVSGSIFTAGEDGSIRAFQNSGTTNSIPSTKSSKAKKGSDSRYKPY